MSSVPVTYQQLLAEQYEENAKDLLVHQQTNYDEVNETYVHEHNATDDVGQTLIDPQEFQRFGGNRGTHDIVLKSKEFDDKGTASVRRSKDVKTNIFNIDSCFRAFAVGGLNMTDPSLVANPNYKSPVSSTSTADSAHFIFNLDSQYKNVISSKLSSLQLPNKFFNLVDIRNNYYIYVRPGYYTSPFSFRIASISAYSPSAGGSIVSLYSITISPLVIGDTVTITGSANYTGNWTVIASTSTTVTISTSISNTQTEEGSLSKILSVNPNQKNTLAGYTQIAVPIQSVNTNPRGSLDTAPKLEPAEGQTGFYYSNTSIIPALNTQLARFPGLSVSSVDGFCQFTNSSENIYSMNFTPEVTGLKPPYYPTLGAMLGYYHYLYIINPAGNTALPPDCGFQCAQISSCVSYGSVVSENKIDMNADQYINLKVADWENVYHQNGADSYYGLFQKIPITVQKGDTIYDIQYNNSISKKYNFIQPENIRYLEIEIVDRTNRKLLMPGVDWSMVLEIEEVLNVSLYEKLREL